MATRPSPPDQADPIDPTIPDELPPVFTPDQEPGGPAGFPEVSPDTDSPGSTPTELPQVD